MKEFFSSILKEREREGVKERKRKKEKKEAGRKRGRKGEYVKKRSLRS